MANSGISAARQSSYQTMSTISFFCAVCGEALTAETSFAGEVVDCTRCERIGARARFSGDAGRIGLRGGVCSGDLEHERGLPVPRMQREAGRRWTAGRTGSRLPAMPGASEDPRFWSRGAKPPAAANGGAPREGRASLTPEEIGFLSGEFDASPA